MLKNLKSWVAIAVPVIGLTLAGGAEAATGPSAKLMQVEGKVEVSKDGKAWKDVTRTKYLFEGYEIRTGADGSGQLVDQATGNSRDLGATSHIRITAAGADVLSGQLSEAEESGNSFFQALMNKFSKAQRYTTVRRSVDKDKPIKLGTSPKMSVSAQYPELVWENVGPEYAYRLTVADKVIEVPVASTAEMIRVKVADLAPGDHKYTVDVLLNGKVVFSPRSPSRLKVLSAADQAQYQAAEAELRAAAAGDEFMIGSFMEEHGFLVPAMDAYREYFAQNPDENEMRPLLIKAYNDLKLYELKDREARTYNGLLEESEG